MMRRRALFLLVGTVLFACGDDPAPAATSSGAGADVDGIPVGDPAAFNAWLQKKEYRAWPKEPAPRSFSVRLGGHSGTVQTYLNPPLDGSMKARGVEHPKGSAAVKEFLDGTTLIGWAAYVKTEDASNGGAAFYWYEVSSTDPGASAIGGQGSSTCSGCHSSGRDFVRVAYPLE